MERHTCVACGNRTVCLAHCRVCQHGVCSTECAISMHTHDLHVCVSQTSWNTSAANLPRNEVIEKEIASWIS